jgi:putative hydrolase of the HAD superfamily
MRKYDHLFFDLDNTLWDFDTNAKLAMQQSVLDLGLEGQIENFGLFFEYYEKINSTLWEAYRKKQIKKTELVKKRFEDTLAHFNIDGVDPVHMNQVYLELMPLQKKLYPDVVETLEYLKNRGYQMHIITNGFSEVQHKKIISSGLAPYFSRIFISEDIQAPKPDKRIFYHALKCCNAKKNRSIMIGDSWESDIIGARNIQMSQIFIVNNKNIIVHPPKKEWGEFKKHYFEGRIPSNMTYIIEKIANLTKFL